MVRTPHDALFKRAFGQPEHAAGELRALLPPDLVARLDFDSLHLEAGSFVDQELGERHSDLLYSVQLAERQALVYLLFEHQSTVDPWMVFRLLRYMVRIWERWMGANREAQKLPVLIPLVLFHGEAGWTGARSFHEVVDLDPTLASAAGFVPDFRFAIDDLSRFSDEQLRERAASALARLALFLFKRARSDPDLMDKLASWADAWREIWSAPDGPAVVEALVRYILQVSEVATSDRMAKVLVESVDEALQEVVMTEAQRLIEQGIERGIEQGIEQGIERGRRQTVLRQLRLKFGPVSDAVVERVQTADSEALERWEEGILEAVELEALLDISD